MKKFLLPFVIGIVSSVQAQTYYYAPQININDYKESYKAVGYDFGYQSNTSGNVDEGYYIWLENEWYKIINAKQLFHTSANHLAFSIDDIKTNKLTLKDAQETVFFYPIEALSKYKIASDRFNKLTSLVVENSEEAVVISETSINGNEVRIKNTVEDKKDGVNLDEISITTEVVEKVIPYEVDKKATNENQPKIIGENAILVKEKREEPKKEITSKVSSTNQPKIIGENAILEKERREEPKKEVTSKVSSTDQPKIIGENAILVREKKSKQEETPTTQSKEKPEIVGDDTIRIRVKAEDQNEYEKAVAAGFDGTVTEWFEYETQKNGISPYEKALKNGFEGTEDDYKRTLWGSSLPMEIQKKERNTRFVNDWLKKVGTSDGLTPYERALKHGFYGSFTEWVEYVIGEDGEKVYDEEVANGQFSGSYREWVESKLNQSNEELKRKDALTSQKFVAVPNLMLSIPESDESVATFSLYDYYQMYFGNSVVSSRSDNESTYQLKPEEIEYQITWYNKKEIAITNISKDGILYYKKNPAYEGTTTNINVKFVLK